MLTAHRLFVAVNLPLPVRHAVIEATQSLRDACSQPVWVPEARLHLTLKFLPLQSDANVSETVAALTATIAEIAARHRGFEVEIGGVGGFPNFRRARVVWLGVDPDPRLELLHHDVELGCAGVGFEVEGRPFRPHITLARIKTPMAEDRLRVLSRTARRIAYRADVPVRSIELMSSHLSTSGPTYTVVASAALRSL